MSKAFLHGDGKFHSIPPPPGLELPQDLEPPKLRTMKLRTMSDMSEHSDSSKGSEISKDSDRFQKHHIEWARGQSAWWAYDMASDEDRVPVSRHEMDYMRASVQFAMGFMAAAQEPQLSAEQQFFSSAAEHRSAAMMAKMAHEKMASPSDLAQADKAAATAKKAAHKMEHLAAYVMECEKGQVKLVALKKQYGEAKGKALRDMLEMQISQLKVSSAKACKKGKKEKRKEKKTAKKAKREKKKMKKKLKKAENKAQKMKAAKKKAKDPTALYKPIKEHKVITAKYIGPPTGAQTRTICNARLLLSSTGSFPYSNIEHDGRDFCIQC